MRNIPQTIPGVLVEAARTRPTAPQLSDGDRVWTAEELLGRVRSGAKAFIAAGLELGDRFAIWAPNGVDWIICALAGQMAGGVLVPLNTRYKSSEAADILLRSQAKFVFVQNGFLEIDYLSMLEGEDLPGLVSRIDFSEQSLLSWREFLAAGEGVLSAALEDRFASVSSDALSDILFTSGTTGRPKGAMTTHAQNVSVFMQWGRIVGIEPGDVYLIANPFFHAFGYKAGWLAAIIAGAIVLPHAVFDVDEILTRIEKERVTVLPGPPAIFQSLLSHHALSNFDISSLKRTITGAASVPEQLVHEMKSVLGFETVLTGYGLTEATGVVSLSRQGDSIESIANYSGCPIDGVDVKICSEDGQALSPNTPGEIWVRGYNVMQGYLDDTAATEEAITKDGWLKTGDIGFQDSRGYLKITGRAKDMFITGGFNCYPAEIENTLLGHPLIADVAVIGAADKRLGEVCHAHIVVKDGANLLESDVIDWARDQMANFKVPRQICFHTELPRNASGKVQKFKLHSA